MSQVLAQKGEGHEAQFPEVVVVVPEGNGQQVEDG